MDRRILGWLGIGIVLRLLIAPFSLQTDMLAVYWRSHLIAFDGTVYAEYMVNMGAHWLHALWLLVAAPLLPDQAQLWTDPWWWADSGALAPQYLREFANRPDAFPTIFILKLPYLVLDLLTGLILVWMNKGQAAKRVVQGFALWMVSPIGLYASAAFGRYEMFAVVFVVWALMLAERNRWFWAALALGVGITMRGYPLLLVPVFALVAPAGWFLGRGVGTPQAADLIADQATGELDLSTEPTLAGWAWLGRLIAQVLWAVLALIPFGIVMVINQIVGDSVGELATLADYHTGSTYLAYRLDLPDDPGAIYFFGVGAVIVLLALLGHQYGWFGQRVGAPDLWKWLFIFHGLMFALATFSVHYFVWFVPFVVLAIMRRPDWPGVGWLHLIQIITVFALADTIGGPGITLGLFSPLNPDMALALPSLHDLVLTQPETSEKLISVYRTVFLATTVVQLWPVVRDVQFLASPRELTS
ncbi:hypothetical protein [Stomatohabitans albus]|uniref:hypothetical protein n=1 Tax=Stomatohabitans albus TaxID=3110766 RepID=UPI00300BFF65